MANLTYATQLRRAKVTDRVAQYEVTMIITDRGDLPDKAVFVKEVVEPDDPKQDKLVRIAAVGDIVETTRDRDAAVSSDGIWRDTHLTKRYESVEQAQVAAQFLQERVNAVVTSYSTYVTDFEADPAESIVFPQDNIGILGPLLDDYSSKVTEKEAQEEKLAEKEDECDEIQSDLDAAIQDAEDAQSVLNSLNKTEAVLLEVQRKVSAQRTAAQALQSDIKGALSAWNGAAQSQAAQAVQDIMDPWLDSVTGDLHDEYYNSFEAKIGEMDQLYATITIELSNVQSEISSQQTRLSDAQTERDALKTKKQECLAEKEEASAVLDALERTENDLLDEAKNLCPSYEGEG